VQLGVYNDLGKVIEQKEVTSGQILLLGSTYRPGTYYIELLSGAQSQTMKVVKLRN
jgi:hypothetical protein